MLYERVCCTCIRKVHINSRGRNLHIRFSIKTLYRVALRTSNLQQEWLWISFISSPWLHILNEQGTLRKYSKLVPPNESESHRERCYSIKYIETWPVDVISSLTWFSIHNTQLENTPIDTIFPFLADIPAFG